MAIIFYASDQKLSGDHHPVTIRGYRDGAERIFYVRGVLKEDAWPGNAFRDAEICEGEICLNAVPNNVVIRPKAGSPESPAPAIAAPSQG